MNLFDRALQALSADDPDTKIALTRRLESDWRAGLVAAGDAAPAVAVEVPGRPARPELVPPRQLVNRKLTAPGGRTALIHAVAHIEFNAINLALDAVYRFRDLPSDYYGDWLRVAKEESHHFELLRGRLAELGAAYGDFPAHNGLWEMAVDTAHDHLIRMALVPRVLEARGLDVTPGMLERLEAVGDNETVEILKVILRDEVGHVAIGSHWFRFACERRGLAPEPTFRALLAKHMRGRLKGPFNVDARLAAGFSAEELRALEQME